MMTTCDWNLESGSMGICFNQSAVGTFGSKVNKVRICTKIRGQDTVKNNNFGNMPVIWNANAQ